MLCVSNHPPTLKGKNMSVSFALNSTATVTVNYDRYFNKFHSYTVDGQSILLSEMDKTDLSVIRKFLVERYDFYEAARKLRDYIDSLLESGGEVEQPEDMDLPFKKMVNEVFGVSLESMVDWTIVSWQLVQMVCDDIKKTSDKDNWKDGSLDLIMEYHFRQKGNDYVYAKLVKFGDAWSVHTKVSGIDKLSWKTNTCRGVTDALDFVARRFW